jgi:hypothetical protein
MNMPDIFKQLGANKVTVTHTTNNMNELDVFKEIGKQIGLPYDVKNPFDVFKHFDKIFGEAFPQQHIQQQQQQQQQYYQAPVIKNIQSQNAKPKPTVSNDFFMLAVASFVDPTMTLLKLEDQHTKTKKFVESLIENLTNHNEAYKKFKLKSLKVSVEDIKKSLSADRDTFIPALYYISHILNKNIIFSALKPKESANIFLSDDEEGHLRIVQDPESFTVEEKTESYKNAIMEMHKEVLQDKEKLKKMTVTNLRTLANELGVNTYKTDPETNKKTLLLKEPLVEALYQVLHNTQ